jgi:hypothetical protein
MCAVRQRSCTEKSGWPDTGCATTFRGMPFKHNGVRRHRIPRARYRVTNWPVSDAGLSVEAISRSG